MIVIGGPQTSVSVEAAADRAATYWWVDASGHVLERRGAERGAAPGEPFETLAELPAGLELLEGRVDVVDGGRLVALVPSLALPVAVDLVALWTEAQADNARLLEDLDSMSATGATLMEADHVHSQLMKELALCDDGDGPFWIAVRSLTQACAFARVALVTFAGDSAQVVAESVFDPDGGDYVDSSGDEIDRRFDARRGTLARLLSGRDPWVVERIDGRTEEVPARSPESHARHDVLAARVTFTSHQGEMLLGAVLCIDRQPEDYRFGKPFGTDTASLVENLAGTIALRVGSSSMAAYQKELSLAHQIQQQILPDAAPELVGFDIAGTCRTYGDVGGDYLDYLPMADGRTLALVADVSGHNLASGMIMVGARSAVRVLAALHDDPAPVFTRLLESIYPDLNQTERFITAAGLALRPGDDRVEIVNAGHNPTLIYRARAGQVEQVAGDDPILGFLPGIEYSSTTVQLQPGDIALVYTDGVTEAARPDGEMFGEERLEATLLASSSSRASEILDAVYAALAMFTDTGSIEDDVTIVAIKRTLEKE